MPPIQVNAFANENTVAVIIPGLNMAMRYDQEKRHSLTSPIKCL
jgi:hypothetical protein